MGGRPGFLERHVIPLAYAQRQKKITFGEHTGEFIDIQGIKIHFVAAGEGEPVLFVHGIGQSAYTFRHNLDEFSKDFFVIAPDMIGYGYSDKPELTYSIEENSEFLLAFLNAMRIKKTHIVAVGSGAVYALDLMEHYPDRVGKAILIAPGGMTAHMPSVIKMMGSSVMGKLAVMGLNEATVRKIISYSVFDQTSITDKDIQEVFKPLDSKEAKAVLRASLGNFDDSEVLSLLRNIPHEVLFYWGDDDRMRPLEESADYVAPVQRATTVVTRNCGHLAHEEKPEKFNETAISFLFNDSY